MITSAYVGVIYCISMLRDFSYINRFSIFAYWYMYSSNNIIIDAWEGLILKKLIKFFKLYKRRIDILSAEAQLKFILENWKWDFHIVLFVSL